MPRKNKTAVELGLLRSYWDELKDMEGGFGARVTTTIYPSGRPGVFIVRLEGGPCRTLAGGTQGPHSVQFEFPNSLNSTFAGALFAYAVKLEDMYADGDSLWTPTE
jgi:hypothetical protein